MFDTAWIADLDADRACEQITATQQRLREQEWRELALAAHWAVLHDERTVAPGAPGAQRARRAGGDGTPRVAEFACAELGVLMGIGFIAAANLIRDAVDLQHRHPRLWAALQAGRGRVWKARKVARMVTAAGLDRDQARFVDTATTDYLDTLTWSAFTTLVEAKIIEADPAAAEERRRTAALARFVATGRSTEHGLKPLVARAGAGEVIYFVAVCDRIAQILALQGDPDPVDVRRSKALAILANPARALAMLAEHTSDAPHPDDPHGTDPDEPDDAHEPGEPQHPSAGAAPAAPPAEPPTFGGPGGVGGLRLDPDRFRPRAVLYVRISEQALRTHAGVAHVEHGVGPVTVQGLADLLGHHHITVRPLLDQAGQVPVDAYEVPHDMREALRLARPASIFPYSHTTAGGPGHNGIDLDHTKRYLPPDRGGPPGQTRIGNLGPIVRFGHRVKTFGRGWRMQQPAPGVYLWRTPHGYWYRVDNDGTHSLGKEPHPTAITTAGSPDTGRTSVRRRRARRADPPQRRRHRLAGRAVRTPGCRSSALCRRTALGRGPA